ncbi:hypothetical protein K491DRAFT_548655, partial [Lophiostoma macrostomum CBS 122681]
MTDSNDSKSNFPLSGLANDGWSNEKEATATCYCGAVQLIFPLTAPGLQSSSVVCNCTDCHKITASMFSTLFSVLNSHLKHVRGQDKLKTFAQNKTIYSGKSMSNHFCGDCGTLMYRKSERFPDLSLLRAGTVDDFSLMDTVLKPQVEIWTSKRVGWLSGVD